MQELVKPRLVLATTRALPNEGGVSSKDDSFTHTSVSLTTYLPIVELYNIIKTGSQIRSPSQNDARISYP